MRHLKTEDLIRKREAGESFLLVNVLDPQFFRKQHIPGSINVPVSDPNFVQKIGEEVQNRDDEIVVYCSDEACQASPRAAKLLDEAGFNNVYDYDAGMEGWIEANQPVDSGKKAA